MGSGSWGLVLRANEGASFYGISGSYLLPCLLSSFYRFIFVMPPVEAPPPSLHACHPPPWLAPHQAAFQEQLACELWPRARPLHRIVCNMRTQFPDLRLIQYDCGEFLSILRPSVFVLFCLRQSLMYYKTSSDLLLELTMTLNSSTPNYSRVFVSRLLQQRNDA